MEPSFNNNFQRVGSVSNTHVGREFEVAAEGFFAEQGIILERDFPLLVGHSIKKSHRFDLGRRDPHLIVECKSYTWTSGGNSPSAKIRGMNEVMLLFSVSPPEFRKILFLLKHLRREISLASHYIKGQGHLISPGVEIWELDIITEKGERLY